MMRRLALPLAASAAAASVVPLITFDGTPATTHTFQELNDPVMGGQSTGTWTVNKADSYGIFDGEVVNVPSLQAPGFIKAAADGTFPDASSTATGGHLILYARTSTPEYTGFRVTFASGTMAPSYACAGGGSIPLSRGCFKAKFAVPAGSEFVAIRIPFSSFSDKWSPATGEQTTTCAEDPTVCPTAKALEGIKRLEVWAEGVAGKVHLEVQAIAAEGAALAPRVPSRPPALYDTCSYSVQDNLRFGISGRVDPDVPVPVDPTETLAVAVCCDSRTKAYAEPQFLFQAPDIDLYSKMNSTGVTTFYDSVCGAPLFHAPVGRSFEDFQADTNEHGWPSFRAEEVVTANVHAGDGGIVYSSCGTHLGSYLPDAKGPRWCMDLSCIAGNTLDSNKLVVL